MFTLKRSMSSTSTFVSSSSAVIRVAELGLAALALVVACTARHGNRIGPAARDSQAGVEPPTARLADAYIPQRAEAVALEASVPLADCEAPECTKRGKHAFDARRFLEAHQLFERACELNDGLGCKWLALDLKDANDPRIPVDPARVASVLAKACDLGELSACWILGNGYLYGNRSGVVAPDPARAVQLYQKGCDGGEAGSCATLAYCYEDGEGVPKNKVLARRYRKRAEELGYVGE